MDLAALLSSVVRDENRVMPFNHGALEVASDGVCLARGTRKMTHRRKYLWLLRACTPETYSVASTIFVKTRENATLDFHAKTAHPHFSLLIWERTQKWVSQIWGVFIYYSRGSHVWGKFKPRRAKFGYYLHISILGPPRSGALEKFGDFAIHIKSNIKGAFAPHGNYLLLPH